MPALDTLIRNVPPGGTIIVKAAALGMSESAFNRLANEIREDDGVDDFDFVKVHRLGESGMQSLEAEDEHVMLARPIDALTLRRRKN